MAIVLNLQMFSRDNLQYYDNDPRYMFVFLDRNQIEKLTEGYLEVKDLLIAVDGAEEWIRFNKKMLVKDKKVFIVVFQRSTLLSQGFREVDIVQSVDEVKEWYQKIDDGFDELRINHSIYIEAIGYCSLFRYTSKVRGSDGLIWKD